MKAQRYLAIAVLFIALCFSKAQAQTVYITESGKKYHAKNCDMLKSGKKSISVKEAVKQGYEPCNCVAEAIEKEKREKANKKKG